MSVLPLWLRNQTKIIECFRRFSGIYSRKLLICKMVPSEQNGLSSSKIESGSTPLFYEVSPWTKFSLRVLGGITALIVVITLLISLVKGSDDSMMYLVAVNMIISSITGGIIAWWYHKGTIEAKKVAFMVFVAVCITFQAIISDIYVYNKKAVAPKSTIAPTTIPVNLSSIATIPH